MATAREWDQEAARDAIIQIMNEKGNVLSELSVKKIRLALEARWALSKDGLKERKEAIDAIVMAR